MDPDQDFFTQLPFDVVRSLFVNYLGASQIAKLSELSSQLQSLCGTDELWRELCRQELRIPLRHLDLPYRYDYIDEDTEAPALLINPNLPWKNSLQRGSQMTFYEFYTRLVFPFRGLLNWFLVSRGSEWNDMLTITAKNGLLRGEVWYPAENVGENMRALPDFTIFIEETSHQVVVRNDFVYFNFVNSDERLTRLVTRGKMIDVERVSRPTHAVFGFRSHPHTARRLKKIQDYLVEQKIAWPKSSSVIRRFQGAAYNKLEQMFDGTDIRKNGQLAAGKMFFPHNPLTSPLTGTEDLGLPSGIFKGKFGGAGVELITLIWGKLPFSDEVSDFVTGFKTASDTSRPSSGYLFLFKLAHHVHCRPNEQTDIFRMSEMENGPFSHHPTVTFTPQQPYQMPNGVCKDGSVEPEFLTGTCMARFVGRGSMLSGDDNTLYNVPAHLLILSRDRFLVLWLGDVRMAVLFEKLSENDRFTSFL